MKCARHIALGYTNSTPAHYLADSTSVRFPPTRLELHEELEQFLFLFFVIPGMQGEIIYWNVRWWISDNKLFKSNLMSWETSWPKVVIMCERLGEERLTSGLSSVLTARALGNSPPHHSAQSLSMSNDDITKFRIMKPESVQCFKN